MVPPWLSTAADWWGKWGIRLAASSSLLLHIVVLILADFRRYNKKWPGWLLFLWAAYQLLDMVGSYALGQLSLDSACGDATKESRQLLVAFWAPFLLLHLGGPDNLGAYSLDDDKLGWRKAFLGVPKAVSALYIVLINIWLADNGGLLGPASAIMFAVGLLRFSENVVAMLKALKRSASIDGVSPSQERRQPSNGLLENSSVPKEDGPNSSSSRRSIFSKSWDLVLDEVTETATDIYEKLYTKAGEVHTWRGYLLRLLSPLATATAFILFGLYPKERVQQVDVRITYVLLSCALLLDLWWLLEALASPYALDFVKARPGIWFRHEILCKGWWRRLNRVALILHPGRLFGVDPSTYGSSCSAYIGRCNLLRECTRAPGLMARLWTSIFGEDVVWGEYRAWKCSSELPEELRELLFGRIKERFKVGEDGDPGENAYAMKDIRTLWGQEAVRRRKQTEVGEDGDPGENAYAMKDIRALWGQEAVRRRKQTFRGINLDFFGSVFQEDILLWHIATTIYLYSNDHIRRAEDVAIRRCVHVIEAVSEYIMFLAAARPHMLPDPPLPRLYEVTKRALQKMYNKERANGGDLCSASSSSAKKQLAGIVLSRSDDLYSDPNTRLIWYAARLASELTEAHQSQLDEKVVNLVFDVWVDKLLYAAIRCSRESHARQLGKGGELVTIAWITAEHAGVFEIGETGKGPPRQLRVGFDNAPGPGPGQDPGPNPALGPGLGPDPGPSPGSGSGPGPVDNSISKPPKCPKEKETCHCHHDPQPACPYTCCVEDCYYCTQDYNYC